MLLRALAFGIGVTMIVTGLCTIYVAVSEGAPRAYVHAGSWATGFGSSLVFAALH